MSTITKERVAGIASGEKCYTHDDVVELARIALASLEAEPVAWTWEIYGGGNMYAKIKPTSLDAIPLYTAPPAPVAVPDAMEMDDDFDSAFEHGKAVGWNACRAAMLQSFGNSEQLNSPVIADGWVACSERMPDPESEYRICAYTPTPHEDVRFRFVPASLFKSVCRDATHWQYMLPPAAPQQEVNNDQ
ncbi:DUF551 domain-containing protein [Enterobacter kobei]|jgi:hypothetical protein|uniref:DUF551 domain-containing protein n=1 Tax=Enterobacter kobei TaxID=208224 RepID=UPI002002C576|nr:DUF551 domain-containing protein [Enterobacter kobei]MCK7020143.1 DUF551 domain-containing protein [Enterobacter kobei]MCQ4372097.1 DUF551 domain-containing protein [Enterobacter kobei]HCM9312672.1 hypothetical protein [Enterobacter kobei]HDC4450286.1 hypothetical protein [Enterobacter kobei]HDC4672943.1 hypothetical protein [Enterobacter kobei]